MNPFPSLCDENAWWNLWYLHLICFLVFCTLGDKEKTGERIIQCWIYEIQNTAVNDWWTLKLINWLFFSGVNSKTKGLWGVGEQWFQSTILSHAPAVVSATMSDWAVTALTLAVEWTHMIHFIYSSKESPGPLGGAVTCMCNVTGDIGVAPAAQCWSLKEETR